MSKSALIAALLLVPCVAAQDKGGHASPAADSLHADKIPATTIVFSDPKLDSPLPLPSTVMDGPPTCSNDGTAIFQFYTSPPAFDGKAIYAINGSGTAKQLHLDQINGLKRVTILSLDPGRSTTNLLIHAIPSTASSMSRGVADDYYYLARFGFDGESDGYSQLNLDFTPASLAQLDDKSLFVLGSDNKTGQPVLALIDRTGTLLRRLDAQETIPPEAELKGMLSSMNFAGMNPANLPTKMRTNFILSLFRFVHSGQNLLLLEPGAGARIVEFSPGDQVRVVRLKLPDKQVADSILPSPDKWYVRTFPLGKDGDSNLYEIDPQTGGAIREIRTSGVPATSIACANRDSFYGLRWIDQKPYVVAATIVR